MLSNYFSSFSPNIHKTFQNRTLSCAFRFLEKLIPILHYFIIKYNTSCIRTANRRPHAKQPQTGHRKPHTSSCNG